VDKIPQGYYYYFPGQEQLPFNGLEELIRLCNLNNQMKLTIDALTGRVEELLEKYNKVSECYNNLSNSLKATPDSSVAKVP
jgi:hypothetical protein